MKTSIQELRDYLILCKGASGNSDITINGLLTYLDSLEKSEQRIIKEAFTDGQINVLRKRDETSEQYFKRKYNG